MSTQRAELSRWTLLWVVIAVVAVSGGVLAAMWLWVNGLPLTDPQKATAHIDAVKLASGVAVGGGGLFTLYLAVRRQHTQELELAQREAVQAHAVQVAEVNRQHAERVADTTERDAAARRVTDLYAKAVEQLGSDKAPVRLGGLYALERLAQDTPDQRRTIINVLCAYLRMPYELPAPNAPKEHEDRIQEREVRLTAQRILAEHLRPDPDDGGEPTNPAYWPGDHDLDLTGAVLIDFNLSNCPINTAKFNQTKCFGEFNLSNCRIGTGTFENARFTDETWFHTTSFGGPTSFNGAIFGGRTSFALAAFSADAAFAQTIFAGSALFSKARFDGPAIFAGSRLRGRCTFDEVWFRFGVSFSRTEFSGDVTFTGALFMAVDLDRPDFDIGAITFAEATFGGELELTHALVELSPRGRLSVWPQGWHPGSERVRLSDEFEECATLMPPGTAPE